MAEQFRNHSIPRDILDELAARFIIPMREEERRDMVRVCFMLEQAHWFYLDFYVTNHPELKLAQCTIKEFALHVFNHVPFLRDNANTLRVEEVIVVLIWMRQVPEGDDGGIRSSLPAGGCP